MATAPRSDMATHPDIIEMRERHEMAERSASTPKAQGMETMALLAGLYLAASPWITGFNGLSTLAVNNLIVGIAYALLMSGGFGRAYERVHSMAWAACALSVWTIIAPGSWPATSPRRRPSSTTSSSAPSACWWPDGRSIGRPTDRRRGTSGRMSAPYEGGRS